MAWKETRTPQGKSSMNGVSNAISEYEKHVSNSGLVMDNMEFVPHAILGFTSLPGTTAAIMGLGNF